MGCKEYQERMKKYTSSLFIIRSLPLIRDSRLQRYNDYLDDDVTYITWEDYDKKSKLLKFGRRDYHLVISYPIFLIRLFIFSIFSVKKNDKVICMDLDTYIPVKLGCLFSSVRIYLDIVDPIAETKFRSFLYPKIFDLMEIFIVSKSSRIILPGNSRLDYYKDKLSLKSLSLSSVPSICENVPKIISCQKKISHSDRSRNIIRIGYFGSLDETRGIIQLVDFFKNRSDFEIIIAGMGCLEGDIDKLSSEISNLQFLGRYKPTDVQELYSLVDFIWAYYSPDVFLHKYACPNKYYEHLAFKVPIIVNNIIPQSEEIERMNSGIVISDKLNNDCFVELNEKIVNYSYQLSYFDKWENEYSNYSFSLD